MREEKYFMSLSNPWSCGLVTAAFMVFCMGCQDQEEAPPILQAGSGAKAAALHAEVETLPEPNTYRVKLKWENRVSPTNWILYREDSTSAFSALVTLDTDKTEYTDPRIIAGQSYRYELRAERDQKTQVIGKADVLVPRDYEVKGIVRSQDITDSNRIFFASGSKIVTDGLPLSIHANEIFSDGGIIESFPEPKTALPRIDGRPGGKIQVEASRGTGVLFIYGRGENGGAGVPGANGSVGKKGEPGHYALGTHETVNVVCNCGPRARALREGVQKLNIFDIMEFQRERARHRCLTQPTNGHQGEQGSSGAVGSNGGRGGDSARIEVKIQQAAGFQIKAYAIPGKGGAGGAGGIGGPGGPGGEPGDRSSDFYGNCAPVTVGAEGPMGPNGVPGRNGNDGTAIPLCIQLGTNEFTECDK